MRSSLVHFVDGGHRQTGLLDHLRRASGGQQLEADIHQQPGNHRHFGLVKVAHTENCLAALGQLHVFRQLRLVERLGERGTNAHHLTGGFHLRAKNRVNTRKLVEREDRLFNAEIRRHNFFGEVLLRQALAHHRPGGNLGQRVADALGDKRHGTRRSRVDFNDIDFVILNGQLHIHQANHAQLHGHGPHLLTDIILMATTQTVRWQ